MIKKVNKNKFGVIEYLIEDMEDLKNLPKKDTDNATYAIMRKGNEKLIYLYSSSTKEWMLISEDLSSIKSSLDNIKNEIEELKQSGGGGGNIDLSDYATKEELNTKADITTVSSHTSNTMSHITSTERSSWNNKSNFNGDYNSLTNKPVIPTKTSQLTNDNGFITSIPSEYVTETELNSKGYLTSHQDISGKADKSTLTAHTDDTTSHITATERNTWNSKSNLALGTTSATAYRGDYGNTAYTHSQTAHAPSNAQKNSDITKAEIEAKLTGNISTHTHSQYLTSHQSLANYPKTSELTLGVHTDGLIYLFKGGQPVGSGIEVKASTGDIVGTVDESKNIILNGSLDNGTYTLKYELEDGNLVDIGTLTIVSSSGEVTPTYTNLANPSSSDWITDKRLSTNGSIKDGEGCTITNYIPCKYADTVRIKGLGLGADLPTETSPQIDLYDSEGARIGYTFGISSDIVKIDGDIGTYTVHLENTAKIRICGTTPTDVNSVIITVNEPIA